MSGVIYRLTPGLQGVHLKRFNFIFPKCTNLLSYTGLRPLHCKHSCLVFGGFWVEMSSQISSDLTEACSSFPKLLQINSMIADRISTSTTSFHVIFSNSLFIHRVSLRRYTVRSATASWNKCQGNNNVKGKYMTSPVARQVSTVSRISCSIFHSTFPFKNSTRVFTTPALTQMRGEFQALLSAELNSLWTGLFDLGLGTWREKERAECLGGGGVGERGG